MSCPCLVSFSVGHYDVLVSTSDSMFSVVSFCDEGVVTGDRCNSRMRSRANRLGILKKVALLIGFPCSCIQTWCLWWFVDGTSVACLFDFYVSVVCMYCVMFDLRRKSPKSPKRPKQDSSVTSQKQTFDKIMDDIVWNVKRQKKTTNITMNHCAYCCRPTT